MPINEIGRPTVLNKISFLNWSLAQYILSSIGKDQQGASSLNKKREMPKNVINRGTTVFPSIFPKSGPAHVDKLSALDYFETGLLNLGLL